MTKLYIGLCALSELKKYSNNSCMDFSNIYLQTRGENFILCLNCDHFKFPKKTKQLMLGE